MDIKSVIAALQEELDYPILIDYVDAVWSIDDGCIKWNTDKDQYALMDGDGNTYDEYMPEGFKKTDTHLIVNVDTCTGTWQTLIFPLDLEVQVSNIKPEDLIVSDYFGSAANYVKGQPLVGVKVTHLPTGESATWECEWIREDNIRNATALLSQKLKQQEEDNLQTSEEPQTGEEMLHWYHVLLQKGNGQYSRYVRTPRCNITPTVIDRTAKETDVPDGYIVCSISYMGCMTKEEFDG